ncbi:hypothetical protein F5X99DRAFT_382698 [Biscogniauxia marginata]|nr:hypothetical protein F5X99DRAFT_382698 [Biscogniauxia marginata]
MSGSQAKEQLKQYRQGYPRLAAFLVLDDEFSIVKRFDYLHMRNILELQDELAGLESRLHDCDDAETITLNLSSRRQDSNRDRRKLMNEISGKLSAYDEAVQQFHRMKCLPEAPQRHIRSVGNWFNGNKPLVRSESRIYHPIHEDRAYDYISLAPEQSDRAFPEQLLELCLRTFPRLGDLIRYKQEITTDDHIFLFRPSHLATMAKILMTLLAPSLLILHSIILFFMPEAPSRTVVYCIFIVATSCVVSLTTNANKYNLLLALLTYAAVPTSFFLESSNPRTSE